MVGLNGWAAGSSEMGQALGSWAEQMGLEAATGWSNRAWGLVGRWARAGRSRLDQAGFGRSSGLAGTGLMDWHRLGPDICWAKLAGRFKNGHHLQKCHFFPFLLLLLLPLFFFLLFQNINFLHNKHN